MFRLSPERGRRLALGAMGRLARLPGGPQLIDFLGHMRTGSSGVVGLGALIDPEGSAAGALARFGVAFVEVGPVAIAPDARALEWARDAATQSIRCGARRS